VPEPASLSLLGAGGAAGMACWAWRHGGQPGDHLQFAWRSGGQQGLQLRDVTTTAANTHRKK
jgi:hypothetical protein